MQSQTLQQLSTAIAASPCCPDLSTSTRSISLSLKTSVGHVNSLPATTTANGRCLPAGSSGAVPLTMYFSIVAVWFLVSVPLTFVGGYLALRVPIPENPVKTNQVRRGVGGAVGSGCHNRLQAHSTHARTSSLCSPCLRRRHHQCVRRVPLVQPCVALPVGQVSRTFGLSMACAGAG